MISCSRSIGGLIIGICIIGIVITITIIGCLIVRLLSNAGAGIFLS